MKFRNSSQSFYNTFMLSAIFQVTDNIYIYIYMEKGGGRINNKIFLYNNVFH